MDGCPSGASGERYFQISRIRIFFTGKLDINKNEIYEGDIVRFRRGDGKFFTGEISYVDEYGAYFVIHSGISDNQLYAFDRYEVIGNIFENPKLLDEE